jgi:hypothetical protein
MAEGICLVNCKPPPQRQQKLSEGFAGVFFLSFLSFFLLFPVLRPVLWVVAK